MPGSPCREMQKMCQCFKIFVFFVPSGDIISVENTTSLHPLSRQGRNVKKKTFSP